MFHADHMFHRSLTFPAREVWCQQAAGASGLTTRKQQIALEVFRSQGSQEPGLSALEIKPPHSLLHLTMRVKGVNFLAPHLTDWLKLSE